MNILTYLFVFIIFTYTGTSNLCIPRLTLAPHMWKTHLNLGLPVATYTMSHLSNLHKQGLKFVQTCHAKRDISALTLLSVTRCHINIHLIPTQTNKSVNFTSETDVIIILIHTHTE